MHFFGKVEYTHSKVTKSIFLLFGRGKLSPCLNFFLTERYGKTECKICKRLRNLGHPKAPNSASECCTLTHFRHFCEKVVKNPRKRYGGQNGPAARAPRVRILSPCNGDATPALQQYTPAGLRAQKWASL